LFCFYSSVVVVVVVYFKDASTVREWASTAFSTPGVSSDRSQWFFGGLFCLPVWPRMCVQFQPHCVVVKGVEQRTIGDLSAIDCSHRCTHSSGISVTACWAHLTPHTFRTLLLLPMSESEAFHLRAVCSSSRDRATEPLFLFLAELQ
jgi:hypothetical protein